MLQKVLSMNGINRAIENKNNLAALTFGERSKLEAALKMGDTEAFMNVLSPDKYKAFGIGAIENMGNAIPDFSRSYE